jgi:hypothetical protein
MATLPPPMREVEGLHEVVPGEVLVGGEDAVQVLAGDVHEPGESRAGADKDRVVSVLLHELGDGADLADHVVHLEFDAELLQVLHFPLHDGLGEAELGDAVDEDAAGLVESLEDGHVVAGLDAVAGNGEPGGAGADDGDLLARLGGRLGHRRLALLGFPVGDEALQAADGHGLLLLAEDADLLALVLLRADAAADGGKEVGILDGRHRAGHVLVHDGLDEGRDVDRHGAALDAEGLLAHEAARSLDGGLVDGVPQRHGVEVLRPLVGVLLRHGCAWNLGPFLPCRLLLFLLLFFAHIFLSSLDEGCRR